jgi:hypothetical protein
VLVPLAAPLEKFLSEIPAGDDPKQPIFPKAAASAKKTGTLSNQFYEIMTDAGLARPRKHATIGKGRSNRRTFNCDQRPQEEKSVLCLGRGFAGLRTVV